MKTNERGEYRFSTIRPGHYPGTEFPEHIHPIVKEADKNEYYIDDFNFDDDPRMTAGERAKLEGRGGNGILQLTKDAQGVWQGRRDIISGKNIPNYPQ
jgi:protocatechuate 3,4-dioxygenase beta subunit